jgi:hypothetical protein
MPQFTTEQLAALKAAGIDPVKVSALNWTQIIAVIESIIAALLNITPPTPSPSPPKAALPGCCSLKEHLDNLKRIATLQESLAVCSQKCLQQCCDCC